MTRPGPRSEVRTGSFNDGISDNIGSPLQTRERRVNDATLSVECGTCGHHSPADFAFCPHCGRELRTACPGCGSPTSPKFAFCPRCGTSLSPAPRHAAEAQARAVGTPLIAPPADPASSTTALDEVGDRRLVTIVFADISGFTALGERLDPEDVRAFQNELFTILSAVIEQYGGFVEKYVGDAVLAVFGAPVAHEDDAERALRAALAMRREVVERIDPVWGPRLGQPVRLHVGAHTGPVVAGALGSHKNRAYAVSGDTVNTAARLQSTAGPGEIMVSAATHAVTLHLFEFEPHASQLLRGRSEPIMVYRLFGLLGQPRCARGLEGYGLSAPLVGRDEELEQMLAAFERARRGRTQVISLIGEAGQGKTRLLSEFLARPLGDDVTVRRFACSSLGEQTYGMFASFVREAYGIAREDSLATARAKLAQGAYTSSADAGEVSLLEPMLGHLLGLHEETGDVAPATVRRQIYSAWRTLVERRVRLGPLVLAIEDVHWADAASLELLHHLSDRITERPLTIVLTHRPSFHLPTPVSNRVGHTAIRLAPLGVGDVDALLIGFFGATVSAWPASVRTLLMARSGGNPLYLEEIVRLMIARGLLERTDAGWRCADDAASVEIPPTIQGLLTARLDQTPAHVRRVLQEAAVLGPRFDLDLLRRITSAAPTLDATLEVLLDGGLIEEISNEGDATRSFGFAHALLHEAAYANLLVSRRTELHASAAAALEERSSGRVLRTEDLESVAHHLSLSASPRKAAAHFIRAADYARGIYANEDAVRLCQSALDVLDPSGPEALAVHERLGDLFRPLGRSASAFQHYSTARAAFEALGRHGDVARLLRKIGGLHWDAGERDAALGCFHAGLELLAAGPDHIERAHLCQELGGCAFRSGDYSAARSWCERALAELGGPEDTPEDREGALALSYAHNTLGITLARMQQLDEAVRHIERSVSMAERHNLLNAAGRGYANLSMLYAVVDAERGIEICGRGLDIARRIGDYCLESRLLANLALAYCALADRCDEQAIEAARASIELDRALEQRDHLAMPLIVLGQIHQCRGEREPALACYREALALAQEAAEPQLLFACYDGLATLFLDAGDQEQAERYLEEADAVGRRSQLDLDGLIVLPFLA